MRGVYIGSKAGAWANQALDYALNTEGPYVAVSYATPPEIDRYQPSRWIVMPLPSRAALDQWYRGLVASPDRYHYLAAFDKTDAKWSSGDAVAASAGTDGADHTPVPPVQLGHWIVPLMLGIPVGAYAGFFLRDWQQKNVDPPRVAGDRSTALQALIAKHEMYFADLAQHQPDRFGLRQFMRLGWDPFLEAFIEQIAQGELGDQEVEALSRRLSELRANATALNIPIPDIGSAGPAVSGFTPGRGPILLGRTPYGGGSYSRAHRPSYYSGGSNYAASCQPPSCLATAAACLPACAGGPLAVNVSGHGGGGHGGGGHGGRRGGWSHNWDRRYYGGGGYGGYDWPWPWYYGYPYIVDGPVEDDQEVEASHETRYDRGHYAQR
jgi:hypothetical protein